MEIGDTSDIKELRSSPSQKRRRIAKILAAAVIGGAIILLVVMLSKQPASELGERMPTITLANGLEYPLMLANTADLTAEQTDKALRMASAKGIRGVDFHENAELAGMASALTHLGRDAFFLTTKVNKPPPTMTDPVAAATLVRDQIHDNMAAIGVEVLDTLMLKDSPHCPVMRAQWQAVEGSGGAPEDGPRKRCASGIFSTGGRAASLASLAFGE